MKQRALLVLLACALAAAVSARLLWRVPESVEVPLVTYVSGMQPLPVEIPGALYHTIGGPVHVHRMKLALQHPEDLLRHRSVRLLVATHSTSPMLQRAELRVVGTKCRYVTAPGASFPNNLPLTFTRPDRCGGPGQNSTGELELVVRFAGEGRVALWTFTQPIGVAADVFITLAGAPAPGFSTQPAVLGSFADQYRTSGVRTISLLSHMWQLESKSWYLRALLAVGAAALIAAVLLCPAGPLPSAATIALGFRAAAAGGLLAFGLGLLFCVVVPPFQAPDEPNHFLGFVRLAGRQAEMPEADRWSRTAHVERLRFNRTERFKPVDARQPLDRSWTQVSPTDFDRRSSTTALWKAVAWLTRNQPLPVAFLTLRVSHAAALGAATTLGLLAVIIGASGAFRHLAFVPILLAPTVPFFGMHVSNHAFLTAAYVLIACGVLLVFLDGPRSEVAGGLLGSGTALSLIAGRSSLPLLPLVGAALLARTLAGAPRDSERRWQRAGVFWGGTALALVGLRVLTTAAGPDAAAQIQAALPPFVGPVALLIRWPVAFGALFCAAGAAAEVAVGVARLGGWCAGRRVAALVSIASLAGSAAIVVVLIASLFLSYPHVPHVQLYARPPWRDYLRTVLLTAASPRLRDPDLLMSTSFWGAFGWMDTLLPDWAIGAFTAATSIALIALLVRIARTRGIAHFARASILFAGGVASLAVYAVGTLRFSPDISGRYLLGLYVSGLAVCWSALLFTPERVASQATAPWRTSLCFGALLAEYAAVFWVLMERYF